MRSYSTLATFGKSLGPEPMALVVGLSARAGALFGDPGPFFVSQAFSLGGVQYGNPLRGYEEFSITPKGYLAERRPVPGATKLVRQCVLYQHRRARFTRQPAAVSRHVLRRGQSLGAAARFRSDPTVPWCRIRRVARHSARSVRRRSRIRVRPEATRWATKTPSGRSTSSSVRSSNRSLSCVPFPARRRSRS